jgi:hypothetical protein
MIIFIVSLLISIVVGGALSIWAKGTGVNVLFVIACFFPIYSYFKEVAN